MTDNTLALKRFDPRKMRDASVCVLIAKRSSGKSILARDLLFHKRNIFDAGLVCSPTEDGDPFFGKFVPPVLIYDEFDTRAIEKLIARQRKLCKEGRGKPAFVILDDCAFDKKTLNSKVLRQIFFNGRHFKIFLIITAQYVSDLQPNLRSNIDYVFCLRENLYREKLYKNFYSCVPNLSMFNDIMDLVTQNFGCLVLDNTGHSNKLSDCLFHYKANPAIKPFKLCSPLLWRMSEKRYDKNYAEDTPDAGKKVASVKIKTLK